MTAAILLAELAFILLLWILWWHQWELAIVSAWRTLPSDAQLVHGQG